MSDSEMREEKSASDDIPNFKNQLYRQLKWAFYLGFFTLSVGMASITIAHKEFPEGSFGHEFLRDLGISVVIAGLLGIFYETFTHWFGRAAAKLQLEKDAKKLHSIGIDIAELVAQLKMANDPVSRIRYILEMSLTPTPKYRPLILNIELLLREIFRIHDIGNTLRAKEIQEYIHLIAWILKKYAVSGATTSRRLLEGMLAMGDDVCDYAPSELRELTLQILSSQMRSMRRGDKYDSLANIWLYSNMSNDYVNTTRQALANGVCVRRIFNLCNVNPNSRAQDLDTALDLVKKHISIIKHIGFEYRFMTEAMLKDLDVSILEPAGVMTLETLKTTYFGHFHHVEDKKMLRFETKNRTDMSCLGLSTYSTDSTSSDYEAKNALFEHLWDISKVIPFEEIDNLKKTTKISDEVNVLEW